MSEKLAHTTELRAAEVNSIFAALDDDDFPKREQAELKLAAMADLIEKEISERLNRSRAPEMRRRLLRLQLGAVGAVTNVETLRRIRAIYALERLNDHKAIETLKNLARQYADGRLGYEAGNALARMAVGRVANNKDSRAGSP